jgi:ferredoxin
MNPIQKEPLFSLQENQGHDSKPEIHEKNHACKKIVFEYNGNFQEVEAKIGENLLHLAQDHNIPLSGACGGQCACATCHVVLDQESFDKFETLPDHAISERELDMLEGALSRGQYTATSRLGCQVRVLNFPIHATIPSRKRHTSQKNFTWDQPTEIVSWLKKNMLDDDLDKKSWEDVILTIKNHSQAPQGICSMEQWLTIQTLWVQSKNT